MKKLLIFPISFLSIFILSGLWLMLTGLLPVTIEINPVNDTITAQIHKRSVIPPFNNIDLTVTNVKQAVLGFSRSSKGGTTYRVELESFNGKRTPVTKYYSSGYSSKSKLQDAINQAIQTKTNFSCVNRDITMIFAGFFFMLIPSIIMFVFIGQEKQKTKNISPDNQTKIISEEEKYKNINDSIIK